MSEGANINCVCVCVQLEMRGFICIKKEKKKHLLFFLTKFEPKKKLIKDQDNFMK